MTRIPASEARIQFADIVNKVAFTRGHLRTVVGMWLLLAVTSYATVSEAQTTSPVSRDTFATWFREVSNAGRWGPDDSLGTLNLVTPQKRAAAARSVRAGIVVSLARPL
ncbi:MAG: hypothetical protein ABIS03_05750, partial [Gemmatimonadaceae bacterium]